MSYEIKGILIFKSETIQRTEKFKVRDFVLEQTEEANGKTFTNVIKLQASQERTEALDDLNIGDELNVKFNIRGSKWEKDERISYFTNLDAWKIEVVSKGQGAAPVNKAPAAKKPAITEAEVVEESDDLPF